jgi:hypothetical protein
MKSENTFKIATIVLTIILILVIGFIAYDKINTWKNNRYAQIYNQGRADIITQVYQATADCAILPITVANLTRNIADVSCIQQAIQQGLNQTR